MEYRKFDNFFILKKPEIQEQRIALIDIVSVRLERQFWLSKLVLRGKRLRTFENIPGESGGYLKPCFFTSVQGRNTQDSQGNRT